MTNKEYYRGVGIGYIVVIIIIVLTYASCGCNVQKKAEARVLSNEQSFNKIGVKWSKINPCENDTTIIGKSDTTITFDNAAIGQRLDRVSLQPYDQTLQYDVDPYMNQNDFSNGPATPMYGDPFFPQKQIRVTKTITIHDTSFRYIRDQRAENILDDSLRSAQFNLKVSEGEKDGWKEKAQDRFKALFIVIALFVIGLIIKFYSKNIFSGLKGFITGI